MISVAAIATVGAGLLLAYMLWRLIKGPAAHLPLGTKVPPVIGGYIPWLGCAITFGKEPLWFVGKAYKKVNQLAVCTSWLISVCMQSCSMVQTAVLTLAFNV